MCKIQFFWEEVKICDYCSSNCFQYSLTFECQFDIGWKLGWANATRAHIFVIIYSNPQSCVLNSSLLLVEYNDVMFVFGIFVEVRLLNSKFIGKTAKLVRPLNFRGLRVCSKNTNDCVPFSINV